MNKNIEAVIFDWAGTTVDYGCFAPVKAFAEVFRQAGIEPTMDEVREPMGMLKRDHIKTMLEMPRIRDYGKRSTKNPHQRRISINYMRPLKINYWEYWMNLPIPSHTYWKLQPGCVNWESK